MKKKFTIIIVAIFVVLTVAFYALRTYAPAYHFVALETANGLMALLSLSSYLIVRKQMDSRPEAFVRGVYSASFLKLMVCMVSILVYVLLNRAHIHKPSVFVLFGIYAVYTAVETWLLSKLARE
ncbi:MAG: hypothetical protein V4649_05465 [Bacteroidota bacterium]